MQQEIKPMSTVMVVDNGGTDLYNAMIGGVGVAIRQIHPNEEVPELGPFAKAVSELKDPVWLVRGKEFYFVADVGPYLAIIDHDEYSALKESQLMSLSSGAAHNEHKTIQ